MSFNPTLLSHFAPRGFCLYHPGAAEHGDAAYPPHSKQRQGVACRRPFTAGDGYSKPSALVKGPTFFQHRTLQLVRLVQLKVVDNS